MHRVAIILLVAAGAAAAVASAGGSATARTPRCASHTYTYSLRVVADMRWSGDSEPNLQQGNAHWVDTWPKLRDRVRCDSPGAFRFAIARAQGTETITTTAASVDCTVTWNPQKAFKRSAGPIDGNVYYGHKQSFVEAQVPTAGGMGPAEDASYRQAAQCGPSATLPLTPGGPGTLKRQGLSVFGAVWGQESFHGQNTTFGTTQFVEGKSLRFSVGGSVTGALPAGGDGTHVVSHFTYAFTRTR